MRKQSFKIQSFLFNVKLGIATDSSGSERATPTFIVPTSNPASRGFIDATFLYNDRNSGADTKGINELTPKIGRIFGICCFVHFQFVSFVISIQTIE